MKIYCPDAPGDDYIWISNAGETGREANLSGIMSSDPVTLIIPGQWTRIFALDLPKLRGAERLNAAGFAIEDRLAAPLAAQHLAISSDGARVGIISKAKIAGLMKSAKDAGLNPAGIYADYDVAAPGPAMLMSGRVIVPHSLTGGADGYAVDAPFYDTPEPLTEVRPGAQIGNFDAAINFASGSFAPRNRGALSLRSLSRVAAMLAVLGVAWGAWQITGARAANAQAQALKMQTAQAYTNATGQAAPANPALAVTRALKSGGGGPADFMSLSAVLFSALETTPGAMIETLDYDASKAQIRVRMVYPNLQTATQMERSVRALGANLSTGNLRQRGSDMMGDAVLKAGGAS